MNKNYVRGRAKEYRICNKLKKQGFKIIQRTAGSHSPIDVIAISEKYKKILFVQSKPKKMSKNKKDEIEQQNSWLNDEFICSFKVE